MAQTTTPPPAEDLSAWQQEVQRLAKRGNRFLLWLIPLTYSAGVTLGTIFSSRGHENMPLAFILISCMPALCVWVAYLLQQAFGWRAEVMAYISMFSMLLSNSLNYQFFSPESDLVMGVFTNIPIFITGGLISFSPAYHLLIQVSGGLVLNFIFFFTYQAERFGEVQGPFIMLIPIAAGSVALMQFRYTNMKRNFLITQALNRSNQMVQEKQQELEKKNQAITDSIRYALRIQRAILPDLEDIKQHLPNSWVFYRPRDIVSGDFYWFAQVNHKTLIAAIDCTGHGVPGAFMSLIGFNNLNEIVNKRGITDPGTILTELNHAVAGILSQGEKTSRLRDGMDMVLCTIDHEAQQLHMAGAHRPLWYFRQGVFHEIKGERMPIGDSKLATRPFATHSLALEAGDRFYLTTDGFADQFGGAKGKKYYTKRFKALLQEVQQQPFAAHAQQLETEYDSWRGKLAQIDDVTVVGFGV